MNIGLWKIGRMLFGQMKPLLSCFIAAVDIESGEHHKKLLLRAVFARDGRAILSLCFGIASLMIRKNLVIFESRKQLQREKRLMRN